MSNSKVFLWVIFLIPAEKAGAIMPCFFQLLRQAVCLSYSNKPESQTVSALPYHVHSFPGVASWTETSVTIFKGAKVGQSSTSPPDRTPFGVIPSYPSVDWTSSFSSCNFVSTQTQNRSRGELFSLINRYTSLNAMTHLSLTQSYRDAHPHSGFAHHLNIYLITQDLLSIKPVTPRQCSSPWFIRDSRSFSQQHPQWFCRKMRFKLTLMKQQKSKSSIRWLVQLVYKLWNENEFICWDAWQHSHRCHRVPWQTSPSCPPHLLADFTWNRAGEPRVCWFGFWFFF